MVKPEHAAGPGVEVARGSFSFAHRNGFAGRMNALLYLSWNSARNRFLSAFRRARSPRYAVALCGGSSGGP